MIRRSLRRGIGSLLLAALAAGCQGPPTAPTPETPSQSATPDLVLLITIDTLRADHLGLYDYFRPVSPFLDRFARTGVVFDRALSSISHTAPSHASLFSSLEPQQHRVLQNGEPLADEIVTMAELFSGAGYQTAAFVEAGFLRGLSQGFDTFRPKSPPPPADVTLEAARSWLQTADPDRPRFVWIHLFDVHQWFEDDHVDWEAVDEVRSAVPLDADRIAWLTEHHALEIAPRHTEKLVDTIDRYDGQILSTDRALERFFGAPEVTEARNPLVVITSDHGEGLGSHAYAGHGEHLYEEQLRVPLLVSSDRLAGGQRFGQTVRLVDLLPTLLELSGLPAPTSLAWEGRSLVRYLAASGTASATLEARPIYAERRPADQHRLDRGWLPGEVLAWERDGWKLIVRSEGEDELFHLETDPLERRDLASEEPDRLRTMRRELAEHYRRLVTEGDAVGRGQIDDAVRSELEALGYL